MRNCVSYRLILSNKDISEFIVLRLIEALTFFEPQKMKCGKNSRKQYKKEKLRDEVKQLFKNNEKVFRISLDEEYNPEHDYCNIGINKLKFNTLVYGRLSSKVYTAKKSEIVNAIEDVMIAYHGIVSMM